MPERLQKVTEAAQTTTYTSGAVGVGIEIGSNTGFNLVAWLDHNAALISLLICFLSFLVTTLFNIINTVIEYRFKKREEQRRLNETKHLNKKNDEL